MAKGVILKTNEGVKLMGSFQCSNGSRFDAEGCYEYCNSSTYTAINLSNARKLMASATLLGHERLDDTLWFKDKNNFIDVDIQYEVNQDYIDVIRGGK